MSVPDTLLYIDGHYVPAGDGETFNVCNPYSRLVVGTAAPVSSKDCRAAASKTFKALMTQLAAKAVVFGVMFHSGQVNWYDDLCDCAKPNSGAVY